MKAPRLGRVLRAANEGQIVTYDSNGAPLVGEQEVMPYVVGKTYPDKSLVNADGVIYQNEAGTTNANAIPGDNWYNISSVTIYVAASDTPADIAKSARFVCDGVNDRDAIIAAADLLGSRGGKIHLLAGNYSVHTLPIRDGLFYEGSGSNQTLSLYGTRLVLDNSTGENSIFRPDTDGTNFFNGGITNMSLQGVGDDAVAVNFKETGFASARLENFDFSGNYVISFKYGWLGGPNERANDISNNFFRGCKVAILSGEHPRIHNNDIRACVFGVVNIFDALVFDNKIIDNTVGIGDINKLNGKSHESQPATATATNITSAGTFVNVGRDTYVVYFDSGNAYRVTSKISDDEVVVDGDPSAETGEIVLTGFGVGSNNISDHIFSDSVLANVILAGDNHYSDNRHLSNITTDYSIGLLVRGNGNLIGGLKYEAQGSRGFTRALIEFSATSFTSAYQTNNTITSSYLANPIGDIIKFGGNGRQRSLSVIGNVFSCTGKIAEETTVGFITRCVFSGNTIRIVTGNSEAYLLGIRDVGSTESNSFVNNFIDNANTNTVAAILEGEWNRGTVSGNSFSLGSIDMFATGAVTAATKLTTLPTGDPSGSDIPNSVNTVFYGTDNNLYFKSSGGTVTQLN